MPDLKVNAWLQVNHPIHLTDDGWFVKEENDGSDYPELQPCVMVLRYLYWTEGLAEDRFNDNEPGLNFDVLFRFDGKKDKGGGPEFSTVDIARLMADGVISYYED